MEVYTEVLSKLRPTLRDYDYKFMDGAEYVALSVENIGAGNQIYIQEILFRAHFGASNHPRYRFGLDLSNLAGLEFQSCSNH